MPSIAADCVFTPLHRSSVARINCFSASASDVPTGIERCRPVQCGRRASPSPPSSFAVRRAVFRAAGFTRSPVLSGSAIGCFWNERTRNMPAPVTEASVIRRQKLRVNISNSSVCLAVMDGAAPPDRAGLDNRACVQREREPTGAGRWRTRRTATAAQQQLGRCPSDHGQRFGGDQHAMLGAIERAQFRLQALRCAHQLGAIVLQALAELAMPIVEVRVHGFAAGLREYLASVAAGRSAHDACAGTP